MARLVLNSGYTPKQLGNLILQIAEQVGDGGADVSATQKQNFQQQISAMIDTSVSGEVDVLFDSPKVVHVVIPYLRGNHYSDNDFANECMGHIIFGGCGL